MKKIVICLAIVGLIVYLWEPMSLRMHRQVFINKIVERVSVKYNDIKNQNINNTDANYYQWEFYSLLKFPKENKNKSDYPSINFRNKLSTYFNADNKKDAICFKSD